MHRIIRKSVMALFVAALAAPVVATAKNKNKHKKKNKDKVERMSLDELREPISFSVKIHDVKRSRDVNHYNVDGLFQKNISVWGHDSKIKLDDGKKSKRRMHINLYTRDLEGLGGEKLGKCFANMQKALADGKSYDIKVNNVEKNRLYRLPKKLRRINRKIHRTRYQLKAIQSRIDRSKNVKKVKRLEKAYAKAYKKHQGLVKKREKLLDKDKKFKVHYKNHLYLSLDKYDISC